MRANVNVFYKCEQRWSFGPLIRFRRSEYQDMQNESVDEDEEKVISIKQYWGKKSVFEAYDTKYLRGGMPDSQKVMFSAYEYGLAGRIGLFIGYFFHKFRKKSMPLSTQNQDSLTGENVLPLETHERSGEKISYLDASDKDKPQLEADGDARRDEHISREWRKQEVLQKEDSVLERQPEKRAREGRILGLNKSHVPILSHIKKIRETRKETRSLRVQGRSVGRRVALTIQTGDEKR
jgi:hypothetical protein